MASGDARRLVVSEGAVLDCDVARAITELEELVEDHE